MKTTLELVKGEATVESQDGCVGCVFLDDEKLCNIDMDIPIFDCSKSYELIWVVSNG